MVMSSFGAAVPLGQAASAATEAASAAAAAAMALQQDSDMQAAMNSLVPALWQAFAVILVGYACVKLDIVNPTHKQGLSLFVTKLSLPALLFCGMSSLDFSKVSWLFLIAVTVGKAFVFIAAIGMTTLLDLGKPYVLGTGAVHAIFVSQSNDFALGLPILLPIFGKTHPEYIGYIFLVAPISLLLLNPVGFFMMESARGDVNDDDDDDNDDDDPQVQGGGLDANLLDCCDDVPEGDEEAAISAVAISDTEAAKATAPTRGGLAAGLTAAGLTKGTSPSKPPVAAATEAPAEASKESHPEQEVSALALRRPSVLQEQQAQQRPDFVAQNLDLPKQPVVTNPAAAAAFGSPAAAAPVTAAALGTSPGSAGFPDASSVGTPVGGEALAELLREGSYGRSRSARVDRNRERMMREQAASAAAAVQAAAAQAAAAAVSAAGSLVVPGHLGGPSGGMAPSPLGGGGVGHVRRHSSGASAVAASPADPGAPQELPQQQRSSSPGSIGASALSPLLAVPGPRQGWEAPSAKATPRRSLLSPLSMLPSPSASEPTPGPVSPGPPSSASRVPTSLPPPASSAVRPAASNAWASPPTGAAGAAQSGGAAVKEVEGASGTMVSPSRLPEGWSVRSYTGRRKAKAGWRKQLRKIGRVLYGVASSPVVFMVPVGLVANWIFSHKIPALINGPFMCLGAAFSPLSLFILGMSMADHTESSPDVATRLGPLLTSLALVAGKCLVCPLVTVLVLIGLGAEAPLYIAGLIYGSLPVTPATFFFACEYGLCQAYIGMATVLGTFLFGPLVYFLTQLSFVVMGEDDRLTQQVAAAARNMSVIGGISAAWTLGALLWQLMESHHQRGHRSSSATTSSAASGSTGAGTKWRSLISWPWLGGWKRDVQGAVVHTAGVDAGALESENAPLLKMAAKTSSLAPAAAAAAAAAPGNAAGSASAHSGTDTQSKDTGPGSPLAHGSSGGAAGMGANSDGRRAAEDAGGGGGAAGGGVGGAEDERHFLVHHEIDNEFICCIALAWVCACTSTLACELDLPPALSMARYILGQGGQMAAAAFTALLAASELLVGLVGPMAIHRRRASLFATGALLTAVATALPVLLTSSDALRPVDPGNLNTCFYPYGGPQFITNSVMYSFAALVVCASLSLLIYEQYAGLRNSGHILKWHDLPLTWRRSLTTIPPALSASVSTAPHSSDPVAFGPPAATSYGRGVPSSSRQASMGLTSPLLPRLQSASYSSVASPLMSPRQAASFGPLGGISSRPMAGGGGGVAGGGGHLGMEGGPAGATTVYEAVSRPGSRTASRQNSLKQLWSGAHAYGAAYSVGGGPGVGGGASAFPAAYSVGGAAPQGLTSGACVAAASIGGGGGPGGGWPVPLSRQSSLNARFDARSTLSSLISVTTLVDGAGRLQAGRLGLPSGVSRRWKQKTDLDAQNGILLYCCFAALTYCVAITLCLVELLNKGRMTNRSTELLLLLHVLVSYSKGLVLFLAFGAHTGVVLPLVALREWWLQLPLRLPSFLQSEIHYSDYSERRWADTEEIYASTLGCADNYAATAWGVDDGILVPPVADLGAVDEHQHQQHHHGRDAHYPASWEGEKGSVLEEAMRGCQPHAHLGAGRHAGPERIEEEGSREGSSNKSSQPGLKEWAENGGSDGDLKARGKGDEKDEERSVRGGEEAFQFDDLGKMGWY